MNKDSRLYRWLLDQQRKTDIKDGMGTGFKHRSAYHREFRGYAEIRVPVANGRFKIKRVYIAPWYRHEIADASWVLMKIFFILGFLGAAALFVFAAIQDNSCNCLKVTGVIQFLATIIMVICLARVVIFAITPRKMTAGQCDGVDRPLTKWLFGSFAINAAAFIWNAVMVFAILKCRDFPHESKSMFMQLGASLILLAIWLVQRKMTFEMLENMASPDSNLDIYEIK